MQALGLHIGELDGGRRVHREVQGRLVTIVKHGDQVYAFDSRCFHQGGDLGGGGDIEDFHGRCVVRCPVHGRRIDLADGRCVDTNLDGEVVVVCTSQGDAALSQGGGGGSAAAAAAAAPFDPAAPPHRVHPVFVDTDGTLRLLIQASGPPRPSDRYNCTGGGGGAGGEAHRPPGAAGVGLGGFPVSPRRAVGLATGVARGAPRPMAYYEDSGSGPSSSGGSGSGGGRSSSEGGGGGGGGGAGLGASFARPANGGPLTPFAGPQADKWAATATAPGAGGGLPAHFRGRKRGGGGGGGAGGVVPAAKAPPPPAAGPFFPPPSPGSNAAFAARGAAARRAVLERGMGRLPLASGAVMRGGSGGAGGPTQLTLDSFLGGGGGRRGVEVEGVAAMDE